MLDTLLERIRRETAAEIKAIRAEAELSVRKIEEEARNLEETLLRRETESRKSQLAFETRSAVATRKAELYREFLETRATLLRQVVDGLEERLATLSPAEDADLLRRLFAVGRKMIPSGRIRISPRHAEVLRREAEKDGFTIVPDDSIGIGFLLESPSRDRVLDMTYATLVDEFAETEAPSMARSLFGEALRIQG